MLKETKARFFPPLHEINREKRGIVVSLNIVYGLEKPGRH